MMHHLKAIKSNQKTIEVNKQTIHLIKLYLTIFFF